jgi:hypothetical protein
MTERVEREIRALGARGFTKVRSSGHGIHGPRVRGIVDAGNERIETLVPEAVAQRILDHVETTYADYEVVAFTYDAVAVPRFRFTT